MASRKRGTRGKPTSPLHLGVSDPEQILIKARQKLSSSSSGRYQYPPSIDIPDQLASPYANLQLEKEEK